MKRVITLIFTILISNLVYALKIENDFIIDSRGNKIAKKEYKKVLILDPAAVEAFYLIGGENNIVAIADTAKNPIWPQEKTKDLPKAGTIMKPSVEQVLMYSPDLVILNTMSESFGESLKARKLNFIINEANSFEQILNNLEIYGVITGKEENTDRLIDSYNLKLKMIKEKIAEKPLKIKGGFLFSTSPMMVFSPNSLPGQIFDTLGIENIAKGLPGGRPILSPEFLLAENPDILVGSMAIKNKNDILNSNPVVKQTKAGQKGNIMIIESDKILRGTPRVIDALEELYKELSNVK
ncbi:MAG: ABC transporter substrate-binding protein [Cetobacterium somerae]|uniref:ABC transporter substrate-binding protein n=1 Tax=Cetobacterium somerae TaxID=188913 RepID=UPI00211E7689|nr:ABC transporter substrate-binding protein [Cetobacterium somerae]MCQ9625379.1 ABC transporter substrate-binding protein [Cetobacterium somerae]WVJ01347.1 ABC transporter substrate-binding protein [Cetobacterium somerae]